MINLGERVRSLNKEGSFQCNGTVVGMFSSEYYQRLVNSGSNLKQWSLKHPGWQDHPVVVVEFDEPQKTATLKEWIRSAYDKGIHPDEAERTYDQCPVLSVVALPYDDLEII